MGKIMYKDVDYSAPTASGVAGVKGDRESTYRTGNVNITPYDIGAVSADPSTGKNYKIGIENGLVYVQEV